MMDLDSIFKLLMVILSLISAMIAERTYRRYERYLEVKIPLPTEHLEMPPPTHRRVITIDVPPPDLSRRD